MKKPEEKVLLYQFSEEKAADIKAALRRLGIQAAVLEPGAWNERVGFLLGIKGFSKGTAAEEPVDFSDEAAIFHNIKNKRLDQVLQALKDTGVGHVQFKAVTTPFNLHWTLCRLCRTIYKEHAYMMEKDEMKE